MTPPPNGNPANNKRQKFYMLVEFPYPSGSGLHVGHAFSFVAADVYARLKRMQGYQVLFPMGWDAFGLPTENYAIRTKRKPQDVTLENTDNFRRQMKRLGLSFDWDREVNTTDPSYYKWTQWIFLKLWENDLAEKRAMPINWCPSCKIGLANEEVIDGNCERCGSETTRRMISQWVIKITRYADRLADGLGQTDFIEKVKTSQINWIGKSEGARIFFKVKGSPAPLEVFTTRPDTLFGATFMVIAPEHPLAQSLTNLPEVASYLEQASKKSELERTDLVKNKTGVFSGQTAINPATGQEIPIWIADFVLAAYGTGAIMAVPAHDERDFEFAQKYHLPIQPVIAPVENWDFHTQAYAKPEGRLINSGQFDGLTPPEAMAKITIWLRSTGAGKKTASYHLRDWIFSRQHYWGEPIPMIDCPACGWQPVREADLPVTLPEVDAYQPTDSGESPLAAIPEWVNTRCPRCGGPARRETDTMPNWAGSNWYFLRYTDPHNDHEFASLPALRRWMPVDIYVGGDEHNTLHLLYSRFIYLFLHDIGAVPDEVPEPYQKRLSHGVILGADGKRMSKSHGNAVPVDDAVDKYTADATRTYLMFMGPFDATLAWNDNAMQGVTRFLDRFSRMLRSAAQSNPSAGSSAEASHILHHTIQAVGHDLEEFKFNTAIAKLMEGLNGLEKLPLSCADAKKLAAIVFPLAPFMAERLLLELGDTASDAAAPTWPAYDPALAKASSTTIAVQVNGKLRGTLTVEIGAGEEPVRELALNTPSMARYITNGRIVKVIYVADKTINFVVASDH